MQDHFYESGTENALGCECLHKGLYRIVGAEHIGFMRSRVNKTPVRHVRGIRYMSDLVSCKWVLVHFTWHTLEA